MLDEEAAPGRRVPKRRRAAALQGVAHCYELLECLHRHAEGCGAMASSAVLECQVAAEGSFAVVTGEARHSSSRREMFGGDR